MYICELVSHRLATLIFIDFVLIVSQFTCSYIQIFELTKYNKEKLNYFYYNKTEASFKDKMSMN